VYAAVDSRGRGIAVHSPAADAFSSGFWCKKRKQCIFDGKLAVLWQSGCLIRFPTPFHFWAVGTNAATRDLEIEHPHRTGRWRNNRAKNTFARAPTVEAPITITRRFYRRPKAPPFSQEILLP
jgi:hypothetical protein